mgnify:CR=1 FL=1
MKRLFVILAFAVLALSLQIITNCSDPLETVNSRNLTPVAPGGDTIVYIDTVFVYDSTYQFDTLIIIDTINQIDTVIIIDSIGHVDTLIIVEPGPDGPLMLCSRLACNQKEIIWMFHNQEGSYRLDFAATTERDKPTQTLVVEIDGHSTTWNTAEDQELVIEQGLNANTTIKIYSANPHALGHSIDICLTMTKL